MPFDPLSIAMIGSSILGAGASIYGADQAAGASNKAARKAREQAREDRNISLAMLEPGRFMGYNAMKDIGSVYGWDTAPYAPLEQLTARNPNPVDNNVLSVKAVKKLAKGGMSAEDIGKIGRLQSDVGAKGVNKLGRFGITPTDITTLQTSPGVRPGTTPAVGAPAPGTAAAAPGAAPSAPGAAPSAPGNFARFFASPDYQHRLDQGAKLVQNSAAARGGLYSGQVGKDLTRFGQGEAAGEYGNWLARQMQIAGFGSGATDRGTTIVNSTGNNMNAATLAQGAGRASAYQNLAGGVNDAIQGGIENWWYLKNRRP